MVTIRNEIQWISIVIIFIQSVLQKSCCENIAKCTETDPYQDLYFDNGGGSKPGRIQEGTQDIFNALKAVREIYLMSSVMCICSFLECLTYADKKLTKTTKIKW